MSPDPLEVTVVGGALTLVTLRVPDGAARGEATGRFIDAVTRRPLAHAGFCHSENFQRLSGCLKADSEGRFRFEFSARSIWVSMDTSSYPEYELKGYRPVTVERAVGERRVR